MASSSQYWRDYSDENKSRRRQLREAEAKQRAQQRLANSYLPHMPADASEVTQLASEPPSEDVAVGNTLHPQQSEDAAVSGHTTSVVTRLAVQNSAAAQPTTSPSSSGMQALMASSSLMATSSQDLRDYSDENKALRRQLREAEAKQRAQQRLAHSYLPHIPADASEVTELPSEPPTEDVEANNTEFEDAVVSRYSSSEVTQLAVPDGANSEVPTCCSPRGLGMQCPECDGFICSGEQLAFFARRNAKRGFEVHLMLKPELEISSSANLHLMPEVAANALASWQCACGHKLGDTRKVGPRKTPMTAFKSSSVKLFGRHYTNKKSQWPTIYTNAPFNVIEVRQWGEFHGQRR